MQKDLTGKRFHIAGMALEVVADDGDRWQTRNLTTQATVFFDKALLDNAVRLGKAEEIPTGDPTP